MLSQAGITLDEVRGSRTSVYAGSFTYDYQSMTHRDLSHYPKYSITGLSTNTILANRISFFFDLHGPSVQVDTACSSSLTGFHLGNQSLQTGESEMAIICGTALHFDPTIFITMTDFGMLSTDGRCRHFDANASGYVRGDGICAIILKKQRAAEINGDNIRAIVRGTGANHDGTKEGLTLPNPKAQAQLVRDVYEAAGLEPKDTGYFEAHGTGTKAGDPREAQGIGSVFASDRVEPLYVGSIKTNIGHLEGASGLAGVIKSMLSIEKGKILPNMHFDTPNPEIDFEGLKIAVPQEVLDWSPENGIRRASINSFGFGGSNAHVVLENYYKPPSLLTPPRSPGLAPVNSRPFLLPLTSHSENGGKLLQKSISKYIEETPYLDIRDFAHSYSTRRTLHQFRAFAIGSNLKEFSKGAATLVPEAKWKRAASSPRLGFVFTGQGAQWYAMGRQLIEESTIFRQILSECEATLQTLPDAPGWSLLAELSKSQGDSRLSESEFSQPLCTALQIALVDVLKLWGIEPNAVVGHSSGEIAAAYAAGILNRRDAIVCAFYRGLYMSKGRDSATGSMMAVGLTEAEATMQLERYAGRAGIAAINSPSSITLSGDQDAILEIKKELDERKVFARLLQVEQAFHSHHMLPLAPAFEQALANTDSFSPKPAKIRMFSSVTARDSGARPMDGKYWSDNMTGRVRFSDAVTGMVLDENEEPAVDVLVEIGPHPALKGPSKQIIKGLGLDVPYVASLDRKVPAYESLLACAGQLFAAGYNVNLAAVNSDHALLVGGGAQCTISGKRLDNLPTYPWDHKSYWAETRYGKEYRQRPQRHSILGAPIPGSPSTHPRWRNYLRNSELTWMSAHAIDGKVILPGAAYFAMAIEAVTQTVSAQELGDIVLSDVSIKAALSIPDSDMGVEIMLDLSLIEDLSKSQSRSYRFTIFSFTEDGETIQNCSGTISATSDMVKSSSELTFEEFQSRTVHCRSASKFYDRLYQVGLQYGDPFRLVSGDFESAPGFAVAPLEFDPSGILTTDADACVLHPTLLDSAFHVIFAALETKLGHTLDDAYVPTFCRSLRVSASMISRKHDAVARDYWITADTDVISPRLNSSDLAIYESGTKVGLVELHGLQLTALGLSHGREHSRPVFFRVTWKEAFNCLGLNATEQNYSSLSALLDCYSHQYPENEILHITSESQSAEENATFDLVVADVKSFDGAANLLRPDGFVISTRSQFTPGTLELKFSQGDLKIWQAPTQAKSVWPEQLTLLLGSSPSPRTMDLALAIQQAASSSKISITTLDRMDDMTFALDHFVSLVGLDEDIFANAGSQTSVDFGNLKKLLCMQHKNLIWLYRNADREFDASCQSLISGLARVARSENESLRLITLELPQDYVAEHVCDWTNHIFEPSLGDDEFLVRDGRLMIPRVEVDEKLNRKISLDPNDESVLVNEETQKLFNEEKTYLIVGGLGGIGRILAQWMFRKGARKFAFLARSGATKADAQATVAWLQKRGAIVHVRCGSVSDEFIVNEWVQSIEGDLGGVFHGATVLQSGSLSEMSPSAWQKVIDPKVKGSYNLHYATIGRPLDFFLCFSSILAIIGFPSEANYSAANGFMDSFIAWRRKQGLPGASMNIGVVADAGLVAESDAMKSGMQRVGMDMVSEDELFFQFEQAIRSQYPQTDKSNGVADHQILSGINIATKDLFWSSKPLFRKLYAGVSAAGSGSGVGVDKDLLTLLRAAESPERMNEILTEAFINKVSHSLSIPSADIHTGLPLSSYGMDSLVAVDFRKWFSKDVGVDLALFDILGSKTTALLIQKVCEMVGAQEMAKPDSLQPKEKAEKHIITSSQDTHDVISLKGRPNHIPLSSFQTRLWFMDNVMEEDGGLSIGMTLMIKGEPQLEHLNKAFHEMAHRNEMLRTRYFEGDEFAEQEVLPTVSTNVRYLDISGSSSPLDMIPSQVAELTGEAMDLEKGEVYRSKLLKLGEAQYAWLFSIHHIAIDGGSRESFMEQIVSCYNYASAGEDSYDSAPKLSYVDFTLWHEDIIKSDQVQSDLAWWKQHLTGASPTSKLMPFAQCDRPEKASIHRRKIRSKIAKTTLKRMKRICSGVDVTPFHFILAALRAFLFRYTSEEDLTMLVINGERPHPSFEGIIGFFVNVIPLRWRGAFEDSFESLMMEAKTLAMESMAHSQAPFDSIVDSLEMGWNPQHFPLGQIALNYQMYAKSPKYTTTDFEILDVHVTDVPTACEMQFEVMEDPESGLDFTLDYDSYLYGAPDMDRFLENFMAFTESAVRDFRQSIEEIDMCGPMEIDFLRTTCWLEEKSDRTWMDMPMWERFTQVVREQPRSVAVKTSSGQSITYELLKRRAEEMAALLQSAGIRQGDRVGVLSHPSIDAIAAMLSTAILRCTYVPLDPNYAQGRVEYMIEDTMPSLILFGPGLNPLIASLRKSTKPPFLSLSTQPPARAFRTEYKPGAAEDIFYIVYTSGSTGKPKGIMVTHDNTRAMLCGRNQALDLSKDDVFLSQSSVSFDISITQTWGSFMSGATVALATNETKQDIEELATFIRSSGVTMIFMTPTQFAMMIENCPAELRGCRPLRAVSMIGEHLHPRLAKAIYDLGIPVTVYNEYGPSETTSQNTLYKVPYPSLDQRTIDVGRPLPNNSVYIVNSKLKPVPAGVTGEVCLGGPQISLGYLGKSKTTNPVFLANPFVSGVFKANGWDRLYRTGDLARFRRNGLIDLEGRISGDKQIKLRGNRIDLEEIESEIHRVSAAYESLPFKQGVVVIARALEDAASDSLTDDRQLVAFIITKAKYSKAEHQTMANILHIELSKTLNGYMLPAYYQMMDMLPTTLSGKVDRVKLRNMKLDPVYHLEATDVQNVEEPAPNTTITKPDQSALDTIRKVFKTVLKLPSSKPIQDNDNFFNLGGQSVLALRLQKALKAELGIPVKLVDIFQNPTPAGLFAVLAPKSNNSNVPLVAPATFAEIDWAKEIHLPDDKRYWPGNAVHSKQSNPGLANGAMPNGSTPKGILLIGADGFVGYYMLKYLLAVNPDIRVYLLSLEERFNLGDLFAAFMQHKLFDEDLSQGDLLSRTEIIQGSMGGDKFGLSEEDFDKLGQNIQSIYHTGGFVSLLATYSDLRARNVQSMLDMIELASKGQGSTPTSLHYISTWSVVHLQTWKTTTRNTSSVWMNEQNAESFQPPNTEDHGYFKTRWVAEMLMEEAARRGFPTTIYRAPAHTAPIGSQSATPPDNFTINMYLSMARTGLILRTPERPDKLESDVGMVPINYLADTIVRLANTKESRTASGEALRLHIINPNSLPYSKAPEIIAQVREDGAQGELLDIDEWFEAITASSDEKAYLEWATYKEYLDKGHLMFTIDDSMTRPLLKEIDSAADPKRVKCHPVDAEYFRSILKQEEMFNKTKR